MWGFKIDLKTGMGILFLLFLCTIVSFPCWLLQTIGLKMGKYTMFIYRNHLDQASLFDIKSYD